MKKIISYLTAAALMLGAAAAPSAVSAKANAKQTVFIYMITSDMEEHAKKDIDEMCGSGFSAGGANVILITDLHENPGIFRLDGDQEKLEDISGYNLFDTDDIYDIMFRYMARYRADKYSVLFWDHGGGFSDGFGYDDTGKSKAISASELAEVFLDIRTDAQRDFGLRYDYETVGFDSCLMSDIQTQQAFSDAGFKYFVGSEDIESSYGWNYDFLGEIAKKPDIDGARLGRTIIETSSRYLDANNIKKKCGASVTDLSKTGGVISQLETVADAMLTADPNAVRSARTVTLGFGPNETYADISELAENLTMRGIDAGGLSSAVKDAFVCRSSGCRGRGISLYFPTASKPTAEWEKNTKNLDNYKTALRRVLTLSPIAPSAVPPGTAVSGADMKREGNTFSYTLTENDKAIFSNAVFAVYKEENGIYRPVFSSDGATRDGDTLSFGYDGSAVALDAPGYPTALEIRGGRRYVKLYRDTGDFGGFGDFRPMEIELDADGGILNTRYLDGAHLAAKDDSILSAGDRVYDGAEFYNTDSSPAARIPDIVTIHEPLFRNITLSDGYVCRFEIINSYGYRAGCSPMTQLYMPETSSDAESVSLINRTNEIYAGEDRITLPCTVKALTEMGYTADNMPPIVAPGSCYGTMHKGDTYIDIAITNYGITPTNAAQCTVTAVSVTNGGAGGIKTGCKLDSAGADMVYITDSTARYIYKLNDKAALPNLSGDLGLNGLYYGASGNYISVETLRSDGTIRRVSLVSEFSGDIRYFIY